MKLVLDNLIMDDVIRILEIKRGKGRDDFPIIAMMRLVICFHLTDHVHWSGLLRELHRNRDLAAICGFDPFAKLPESHNVSRFLGILMKVIPSIEQAFHKLVDEVHKLIPYFGTSMAADSKAIHSYAAKASNARCMDGSPDRRGEHDADVGQKTKFVEKPDGTKEEKVFQWFGFKVHPVVDVPTQLPVAFQVTKGLVNDGTMLLPLVEDIATHHPVLMENCETLAADKAYDDTDSIVETKEEHGVDLLVPTRKLWKKGDFSIADVQGMEQKLKQLPVKGMEELAYDQDGQIYCFPSAAPPQPKSLFLGFGVGPLRAP
ncbi:MAG: transposase, partial [Candidatus Latescibacterota bacterium]